MQVATLFRESTTLLGASMEAGGGTCPCPGPCPPPPGQEQMQGQALGQGLGPPPHSQQHSPQPQPQQPPLQPSYDHYNHPANFANNKYKLNMKLEPHDDGYETSADMLMSKHVENMSHNHNHDHHDQQVKCEKLDDPYSFIDEEPMPMLPMPQHHQQHQQHQQQHPGPPPPHIHQQQQQQMHQHHQQHQHPQMPPINTQQMMPGPKKRGRKKKIKPDQPEFNQELNGGIPRPMKERKKHDRFNGMPEEEVSKRTLPDHLTENLDIIIIGINPGLFAAYKGHHYAGPGNHFWKCLYLAGLTAQQMSADEDYKLMQVGIGFTNMVSRATKGSADLTRKEIKEGSQILLEKLRKFRPKIAVFNGKLIYEVFSGKKDFKFGRQPDLVEGTNTHMWVMPSSSARCAQLPRAADKVPFYAALKKFRDYLNGVISEINEEEMVFTEPRVKSCYEAEPKPDPYSTDLTDISNAVIKNEDGTIVPCKKKRGRPKKIKVEGEEPPPKPVVRKPPPIQNNNCDFPKKKRGRPKKVKVDSLDMNPNDNTSNNNPHQTGPTNMSQWNPDQSPLHQTSTGGFYQMGGPALTPPNSSSGLYAPQPQVGQAYSQSPRPQHYASQSPRPQHYASQSPRPQYASQSPRPQYASQSPRPHSQPFTHSDLSSEISAAISSEQLGSPASPIGPLDFEPPHTMADEAECRLGTSPAPSSASEHSNVVVRSHYPSYHSTHYNMEPPPSSGPGGGGGGGPDGQGLTQYQQSPRANQDIASKSLSGLESLVDQIPSITDGEAPLAESPAEHHYSSSGGGQFGNYPAGAGGGGQRLSQSGSPPAPSGYVHNYPPPPPSPAGYPLYPTPSWGGHHYDGMPPLAYPQLPYATAATQGYGGGHHPAAIHVPSPNYPYYSSYPGTATGAHPPGYPPYLGGF